MIAFVWLALSLPVTAKTQEEIDAEIAKDLSLYQNLEVIENIEMFEEIKDEKELEGGQHE